MRAVLLSGGMDSAALAFWLKPDLAITVDYGQLPAAGEIRAATAIASALEIPHEIITTDTRKLGLGTMAGASSSQSPFPEWWPFRNQLLLTVAAMRLAASGPGEIAIGTVATDKVHSDGRPEFFDAFRVLLSCQEPLIELSAPASQLTSAELIVKSGVPLDILGWTISCHVASVGCGDCRGCYKHIETMAAIARLPLTPP